MINRKTNTSEYLLVFIMLYFSNITLLFGSNKNALLVTLSRYGCLVLAMVFGITVLFRGISMKGILTPLAIFVVIQVINVLIGKSTLQIMVVQLSYIFCAAFFVLLFDFYSIKNVFCDVVCFLAVCSIIANILAMALPGLANMMPIITNTSGTQYRFFLFANRNAQAGLIQRNQGIFWEAGTFSIFLNIAIFIILFDKSKNKKIMKLFVLCLAEMMTLSTGGLAALLLILFIYYVSQTGDVEIKRKILVGGLLLAAFAMALFGDVIIEQVFKRNLGEGLTTSGSTVARFASVVGNLRIAWRNPLLGCGYTNIHEAFIAEVINIFSWELRTDANTNTLLYNFAVNGIIYGWVLYAGLSKTLAKVIQRLPSMKCKILAAILAFVLFMNENLQNSAFVYILAFFSNKKDLEEILCQCLIGTKTKRYVTLS